MRSHFEASLSSKRQDWPLRPSAARSRRGPSARSAGRKPRSPRRSRGCTRTTKLLAAGGVRQRQRAERLSGARTMFQSPVICSAVSAPGPSVGAFWMNRMPSPGVRRLEDAALDLAEFEHRLALASSSRRKSLSAPASSRRSPYERGNALAQRDRTRRLADLGAGSLRKVTGAGLVAVGVGEFPAADHRPWRRR